MPTLPITPEQLAVALLLATIGSVIQGAVGFGLAVISAPILLLLYPQSIFVPGPLLLAAMMLTILIAHRERSSVAVREVGIGTVGRVLGMLPAAYAVSVLDERYYHVLFAILILLGVMLSISGWHLRPTPGNLLAASTLSGFTGTISSVGGPPLALVYQHEEGRRIRGTMSAIFTVGTVISLAGLAAAGKFHQNELLLGLALAPAVVIGFIVSGYTTRYIDGPLTRPVLLIASALSAAAILVRALWF
ncbi:MAG: sulfite exporter TauE/SafE family protein [Pirellulales bacterium]